MSDVTRCGHQSLSIIATWPILVYASLTVFSCLPCKMNMYERCLLGIQGSWGPMPTFSLLNQISLVRHNYVDTKELRLTADFQWAILKNPYQFLLWHSCMFKMHSYTIIKWTFGKHTEHFTVWKNLIYFDTSLCHKK